MYLKSNQKHRKPDFLMVICTLVGLAMAATLTLHVHALSSGVESANTMIAAKVQHR